MFHFTREGYSFEMFVSFVQKSLINLVQSSLIATIWLSCMDAFVSFKFTSLLYPFFARSARWYTPSLNQLFSANNAFQEELSLLSLMTVQNRTEWQKLTVAALLRRSLSLCLYGIKRIFDQLKTLISHMGYKKHGFRLNKAG